MSSPADTTASEFDGLTCNRPLFRASTVLCSLPTEQLPGDLWPGWVAGGGDEEGWLALSSHDGHGILKQLLHVSWPSCEAGGQDDPSPHSVSSVACIQGVLHCSMWYSQSGLCLLQLGSARKDGVQTVFDNTAMTSPGHRSRGQHGLSSDCS